LNLSAVETRLKNSSEKEQVKDLSLFNQLTEQETLFCFRYVEQFSVAKAAKQTGLSAPAGNRLLGRSIIRKFIRHLSQDLQELSLISKAQVETFLLQLQPMVMGEQEVPLVDKGVEFTAKKFDATASISLAKEMAKHAGVEEIATGVSININFGAFGVSEDANPTGVIIDANPTDN
jgi:phage terminase small subunit